jgi:hypothetical protein
VVSSIRNALDERANKAETDWMYWLDNGSEDPEDYCRKCFDKKYPNVEERGGGYWYESDSVRMCAVCGKLLRYTLGYTDLEAEHFAENSWDWDDIEECFEVAALLGSYIGDGWFQVSNVTEIGLKALRNSTNSPPELVWSENWAPREEHSR